MELIRKPTEADYQPVLALIKEFETESFAEYGIRCDDATTMAIMPKFLDTSLIMEKDGQVIGVIAGILVLCPTDGQLMFQEALWFVRKEYRAKSVKLFKAMEDYCKDVLQVKKIIMCGFGEARRKTKDNFFRMRGYKIFEVHYIKTV